MGRTIGVYFDDDLLEKGQAKAAAQGGKFSTYVQRCLAADLANETPEPLSASVVVDIACVLIGDLDAKVLAKKLEGSDQPRLLQAWIRELLADEGDDDEPAFDIRAHAKTLPSAVDNLRARRRKSPESA